MVIQPLTSSPINITHDMSTIVMYLLIGLISNEKKLGELLLVYDFIVLVQ